MPPSIIPFTFGEEPLNTGEGIGVQCVITKGDLPLEIRWFLNDNLLVNNQNSIKISKFGARTSVLNIDSLNDQHRGVYKCLAINIAGKSESESTLFVNGSAGIFMNLLLNKI